MEATNRKGTDLTVEELTNLSPCSSSNLSMTQSSERDSEDYYSDIGFMFEGLQALTLKRFSWGVTGKDRPQVRVALHVVDETPGALQSGHYLWPAALSLAEYMMECSMNSRSPLRSARNVMELGAGSALLSLFSLQLMHASLQCLVVTDHDPGTLERARDNYETTLEDCFEKSITEEEQFDCINGLGSVPIMFETMEWGDMDKAREVARAAADHSSPLIFPEKNQSDPRDSNTDNGSLQQGHSNPNFCAECNIFDLLLGSDLIYAESVVKPLFESVSVCLAPDGTFLLSQSMKYDDATEGKIDEMCKALNLERAILKDSLEDKEAAANATRIQQFTWKRYTSESTSDQE